MSHFIINVKEKTSGNAFFLFLTCFWNHNRRTLSFSCSDGCLENGSSSSDEGREATVAHGYRHVFILLSLRRILKTFTAERGLSDFTAGFLLLHFAFFPCRNPERLNPRRALDLQGLGHGDRLTGSEELCFDNEVIIRYSDQQEIPVA